MQDKKILVCITGGIAVYKICTLVNLFIKEGAKVKVLMSKAATKFVNHLTFQSLTQNPVYTDMFKVVDESKIEHIELAKWADVVVVAPATANSISKISLGIADNLLTTVVMALPEKTKMLIVPAMNTQMWNNQLFQNNLKRLKRYKEKYHFIGPISGILACRKEGKGKIASNKNILEKVKKLLYV